MALLLIASCSSGPELVEVPHPDLAALEPAVQDEMRAARENLDAYVDTPGLDDAELGRAYGEAGMLYHAYSLREAAEACYLNAASLSPRDPDWPYFLGKLRADAGETGKAVESFERSIELEPDDLPALIRLATVELDAGNPDRAEELLRRGQGVDPSSAAALFGLGKVAAARRDHEAAVGHFEAALRLDPDASEVHYPLGLAYRGLGRNEEAESWLARRGDRPVALADPRMDRLAGLMGGWRVHQNRGTQLFQQGLYAQALDELRQAEALAPNEAVVQTNLGSTLTMLGDLAGAREAFEKAVELDAGAVMAHFNLGTLDARAGNDAAAVAHYSASLATDPAHQRTLFNMANALRRLGRFEEAAERYRAVIEADPRNAQARLGEAFSLIRLHDYRNALQRLEEGAAALPENNRIHNALLRILAAAPEDDLRNGDRAVTGARVLLSRESSLDHVVTLAMATAEVGAFDEAVEWQQQAIDAVRRAGRSQLLPELEENLRLYRSGEPCRTPWHDDSEQLSPPPLQPS
jgi:tetratricopeptide (TPR) repeat protein